MDSQTAVRRGIADKSGGGAEENVLRSTTCRICTERSARVLGCVPWNGYIVPYCFKAVHIEWCNFEITPFIKLPPGSRLLTYHPRRLGYYGAVGRNVPADHRARSDSDVIADFDITYNDGSCADEAVIANLRGFVVDLAYGNVLVDAAVLTNAGVAGDVYAVEAVRQGRNPGDHRVPADVAAGLVGHAVKAEGADAAQQPALCPLTEPEELPVTAQIVA